jgi:hypothetical protein
MLAVTKHFNALTLTSLVLLGVAESVANAQGRGRFPAAGPSMRFAPPSMGRSFGSRPSTFSRQPSAPSRLTTAPAGRSMQGFHTSETPTGRRGTTAHTSRSIDPAPRSGRTRTWRESGKPATRPPISRSRGLDRHTFIPPHTWCRFPRYHWPYGCWWWGAYQPWWWQSPLLAGPVEIPVEYRALFTVETSNDRLDEPDASK